MAFASTSWCPQCHSFRWNIARKRTGSFCLFQLPKSIQAVQVKMQQIWVESFPRAAKRGTVSRVTCNRWYCLRVQKPRSEQAPFLPHSLWNQSGEPFLASSGFRVGQQFSVLMVSRSITPLSTQVLSLPFVSSFLKKKVINCFGFRTHPTPMWSHMN